MLMRALMRFDNVTKMTNGFEYQPGYAMRRGSGLSRFFQTEVHPPRHNRTSVKETSHDLVEDLAPDRVTRSRSFSSNSSRATVIKAPRRAPHRRHRRR